MKTYLDCVPCFVRQALQAARFVSQDEEVHEGVLRATLEAAAAMDLKQSPPVMAVIIQRAIHEYTGNEDPYFEVKQRFNRHILKLLPELRETVERSDNPFASAVRLSIAGNVIDFGPYARVDKEMVDKAIIQAVSEPFPMEAIAELEDAVARARSILYLADNAGEIVFDRLLIERMPLDKITVAVKGGPILNDALMADAETAGLNELVTVIDNGSNAPGTILQRCSSDFRRLFESADLVISKGQANFETLSDVEADIFFLLKAKCPVIARELGSELGEMVVRPSESMVAATSGQYKKTG